MYQTSPYSSLSPNVWGAQNIPGFGLQSSMGQSLNPYSSGIGQSQTAYGQGSPLQSIFSGTPQGYGTSPSYISPELFSGSLRGSQSLLQGQFGTADTIFIAELSRSARGLQEVADQVEGREPDAQKRGILAATAHLFYVFGLLSSKGVFIPGDLPGKSRTETGGPANATREFGKQLERFVEKIASGRNPVEELSLVVERGKICFTEITRAIESGESTTQESRKKAA